MEQALDNMAALPIWAKVLLVAVALMPWVVTLRTRVKARREGVEGEYEAWRRVLGPRGWIGRRGRRLPCCISRPPTARSKGF